ncbi:N-6 DNA methylase [Streptomyces virginiae]|uniref:N-6 DNA methylase n=1 Tax=Streptomyces TaxID=1883 RepID=UPI0006AFE2AB|nr:N-6 DNA methylase [Streptomyces sp. H021]KOV28644.1 hypothetical protein ADK97_34340 [Streptomyces sp. H021]
MPKQSDPPTLVTAADISRLADVTRATVSNWRRRHADFPAPVGGTEASPAYDVREVEAWLAARGQLPAASPLDAFKAELRRHATGDELVGRLNLAVLAAVRLGVAGQETVLALSDSALVQGVERAVRAHAAGRSVPGFSSDDAAVLRALVRCVQEFGGAAALDALADRAPADTGARGIYATPPVLADLMAYLAAGGDGAYPKRVFDPACGAGGLLAAAAGRGASELYGQDVVPAQAEQGVARLGILTQLGRAAAPTVRIEGGDSLRQDAFPDLEAEAVLCNPPYGDRDWGHDELAYDARWAYGVPAKGEPELAWVQHSLAHLAPGGYAVLALPPGIAERASGRRIRAELVRRGAVRAIVALPAGLAPPLHVGLHVWVLRRPEHDGPETSTVLFVDAAATGSTAGDFASGGSGVGAADSRQPGRGGLRETVERYWRAFTADPYNFDAEPGVAHAVGIVDLLDDVTDLTPARHTRTATLAVSPSRFAERARRAFDELGRAVDTLADLSSEEVWSPVGGEARIWRTATVADLTRGAALTVHHTPGAGRVTRAASTRGASTMPSEEAAGRRVLVTSDVASGLPASGNTNDFPGARATEIRPGDVLLPQLLHGHASGGQFRVANTRDAGCLLGPNLWLFRLDPARLDPWFLAGFLSAEDNVHSVATGSTIMRVDARRLRVPLLPLAEQRQYGNAFRYLHELRSAANRAAQLATDTTQALKSGLTGGALLPPASGESPSTT